MSVIFVKLLYGNLSHFHLTLQIEISTLDDNGVLEGNSSEQGFVQGESAT